MTIKTHNTLIYFISFHKYLLLKHITGAEDAMVNKTDTTPSL